MRDDRIETGLREALSLAETGAPPRLAAALWHSVFPGGARLRPRLALAAAAACGNRHPALALGSAVAIELLHCASLVHDDLPCFDDGQVRRGRPSVQAAFGEALAVLAGDALIVLAFETLARSGVRSPSRMVELIGLVGRAVGMPGGITAGQAWECEPFVELSEYHRAKTGVLFAAATAAGGAAGGGDAGAWWLLGERLGEAYQVADDIRDVAADPAELGKPVGRDKVLGRRSAVAELGLEGALDRFDALLGEAAAAIPACPGRAALETLIVAESRRFVPKTVARVAA